MSICRPALLKRSIVDITAQELRALGVSGVLLDVDNTLTTHDSQAVSKEVTDWLSAMQQQGFSLTVVSNGKYDRVLPFAQKIGLPFISMAAKPLPFGLWRAARSLHLPLKRCVVIGDQVFTDLLGGKLAGIRVVLLRPIEPEVGKPFMQFKRRVEKHITRHWPETEEW